MDVAGVTAGAMELAAGRGKGVSGAPGQLAKAAVQEAQVAGAELPKNAQGIAASSIAKGADPASVFSALIPEPVAETPDVAPDTEPDGTADAVSGGTGEPEAEAAPVGDAPVSDEGAAASGEPESDGVTPVSDDSGEVDVGDASGFEDNAVPETETATETEAGTEDASLDLADLEVGEGTDADILDLFEDDSSEAA